MNIRRKLMRKLKLQVFMSIDGFIAASDDAKPNDAPSPEEPPGTGDEKLDAYLYSTIDSSDTILLGRKMSHEFISYWENIVYKQPDSPEYSIAKKLVDTPKIVFTKTLKESIWNNTKLATGDLVDDINQLKVQAGKDMIVYGGGGFVSSLIEAGLIDEFHLFINPNALGKGMPIFHKLSKPQNLKLISTSSFSNGVALLVYELKRD
jgi:dihydrofolate reductase